MNQDNRLKNCNFVKTCLMLSVVLYHCVLFWNGQWFAVVQTPVFESKGLDILSKLLNTFHIYSFTLVSGYIFYYIKIEKSGYGKFWPFVKKKFTRLIVPYVFVAAVWVVPCAVYFFGYDFATVFKRYCLMVAPNQLWFLIMLFNVFLIAYMMSGLWAKHSFVGFLSSVALLAVGTVGEKVFTDYLQVWTTLSFVVFFWLGFYLRQNKDSRMWKIPSLVYVAAVVGVFALVSVLDSRSGIVFKVLSIGCETIMKLCGAVAAFVVLQRIADNIKWNGKIFGFVGDNSMVVYLLHQQIIYFTLTWFNGMVYPWIHAGLNFIISLGVSLLLAFVLKKIRILRFLLGEG